MDISILGSRIREHRKARKMSTDKFAEAVGLSSVYLGEIERGEGVPSLKTFTMIANYLGLSADYLLSYELVAAKPYVYDEIAEKTKDLTPQQLKMVKDIVFTVVDNFRAIDKSNAELKEGE